MCEQETDVVNFVFAGRDGLEKGAYVLPNVVAWEDRSGKTERIQVGDCAKVVKVAYLD